MLSRCRPLAALLVSLAFASSFAQRSGGAAAQQIKPQAKVLANDRGIDCVTLDYDAMRGVDDVESRLF